MPWSINGREIFAPVPDQFPIETEALLDWAEEQDDIPETVLMDLRSRMPRRNWADRKTLISEVQNYTWTMPDGSTTPVWGGVTQGGLNG